MNIINNRIKEVFTTKTNFLKHLGINPNNQKQTNDSISKKIESVKNYIKPLGLELVIVDKDFSFEKVNLKYEGDSDINDAIKKSRELMSSMGIKIVELNHNGAKITIEL